MKQSFSQDYWDYIKHLESGYNICRKAVMSRYKLSAIEVDVLLFLANNAQYDTAAEISAVRRIPKSHVSLAVKLLHKKKYLSKTEDEANRRRVHLVPTEAAAEIIRFGIEQQKQFTDAVLSGFSEDEINTLCEFFERMTDNLSAYETNIIQNGDK